VAQSKKKNMKHTKSTRNRNVYYAIAVGLSALSPLPTAAQDAAPDPKAEDAGQVAFNTHCRNCHSMKPDDHRLGPSLHGMFGAPAGQAKGFANYSGGLTSDINWDEANLDKLNTDPKTLASNTTMTPFGGVQEADQRKLIIEYLKSNGGS
jgi:cytochrome c